MRGFQGQTREKVSGSEPGDTVFIWETGPARGIRGVTVLDTAPREMAELETEQHYNVKRDTQTKLRVLGTLTHRGMNLSHKELRKVPGLKKLSVFQRNVYQQATNFSVTPAEGAILLCLVKGEDANAEPGGK